jgi:ribosomal protein S18 acetylase RimI-like enzyme
MNGTKTMGMRPNIMCAIDDKKSRTARPTTTTTTTARAVRIEPVDNWHSAWRKVLAFVEKHGDARKLQVDADGWLSARQVLMVAFVGDQVAAHVCFSVAPGKTCIEATLDDQAIAPNFTARRIESRLLRAVVDRAQSLGCEKLNGFKLSQK